MVYYLQQHSTILTQISQQIASIAPQVSIPSTPPPPFPPFDPSASDVRVNAFWFMALTFSLSAALLAILVQQWVRDYMHVFQRYSDLRKSARMRQYLYEGSEGWYMPIAGEAVPGLIHVSLFLFFVGLADSTLNINTTVGLSTTVPIGICGLLYIFTTFAPVIYPQSPYQTSFSGVIWYAIQTLRGRRFKDRDGKTKPVSTNMAEGQMQLSTEETKERNGRDKRAILWLLGNLTEDAEIESFVTSARDSFEVWTKSFKEEVVPVVAESSSRSRMIRNVLASIPRQFRACTGTRSPTDAVVYRQTLQSADAHRSTSIVNNERIAIQDFCWRIGRFFNTCKDRAVFASEELWWMRARACVETMASLVSFANVEAGWFGDTLQVLGEIGNLPLLGKDEAFVVRWTCLSVMTLRPTLNAWKDYSLHGRYCDALLEDRRAREADEIVEHRWDGKSGLSSKIPIAGEYVRDFILDSGFDEMIYQRVINQLPGLKFYFPDSNSESFLQQTLELFHDPAKLRIISCRQSPSNFLDFLKRIDAHPDNSPNPKYKKQEVIESVFWPKHLLQRRLWTLNDLFEGHAGLGFAIEVFLLSLKHLLSLYPSHESYSTLFIGTFRAITSDWRSYRKSRDWTFDATQNILLDVVASDQGLLRTFDYPDYITDEVWALLGDMLEGRTGPDIDIAVQKLSDLQSEDDGRHGAKASVLISQLRSFHYRN